MPLAAMKKQLLLHKIYTARRSRIGGIVLATALDVMLTQMKNERDSSQRAIRYAGVAIDVPHRGGGTVTSVGQLP